VPATKKPRDRQADGELLADDDPMNVFFDPA
jgi:hypothetical protein